MISNKMKRKAAEARRDGYMVFDLEGGPIPLSALVKIVQDIFPNHTLDQLTVTQAEEDQFVITAEPGIETKPS